MMNKDLGQFMTPLWAAEELVKLADLSGDDRVVEPSCGDGSFLRVIPSTIEVVGVEIDPVMADKARQTGRAVITGDFREVELPFQPTVVLGNPPFRSSVVTDFISRCRDILPSGGRVLFLLSTHIMQTPETVLSFLSGFGVEHWIAPRTVFPRLQRPVSVLKLVKDAQFSRGLFLYEATSVLSALPRTCGENKSWKEVVHWILLQHNGRASLQVIYRSVEPVRPTVNRWWREKVRQVLQLHFVRISRGVWAISKEPAHEN